MAACTDDTQESNAGPDAGVDGDSGGDGARDDDMGAPDATDLGSDPSDADPGADAREDAADADDAPDAAPDQGELTDAAPDMGDAADVDPDLSDASDADPDLSDADPDISDTSDAEPDAPDAEPDAPDAEPDVPLTVLIEPTTLDFGEIYITAVRTRTITVSNNTRAPLPITPPTGRAFSVEADCDLPISPGTQDCVLTVTFAPVAPMETGNHPMGVGDIEIPMRAGAAIQRLQTERQIDVLMEELSADIPVVFTNRSTIHTGPLTFELNEATLPFQQDSEDCAVGLAPGASCTVDLSVTLTEPASGSAFVRPRYATDPELVTTSVLVRAGAIYQLEVDNEFLGNVQLGDHVVGELQLTNQGSLRIDELRIFVQGEPEFSLEGHTCAQPLRSGESCTARVRFEPTGLDFRFGTLTAITEWGSRAEDLVGRGDGAPNLSVPDVDFGGLPLGFSALERAVIEHLGGRQATNLHFVGPDGSEFELVEDCDRLGQGEVCGISVLWARDELPLGTVTEAWELVHDEGRESFTISGTINDETRLRYPNGLELNVGPGLSQTISFGITSPYEFDVDDLEFELDAPDGFTLDASRCDDGVLAGQSCRVFVSYTDQDRALRFGQIHVAAPTYGWNMPSIDLYGGPERQVLTGDPAVVEAVVPERTQIIQVVWVRSTIPEIATGPLQVRQRALPGVELVIDDCSGVSLGGDGQPTQCRLYMTLNAVTTDGAFEVRAPLAKPLNVRVVLTAAE
jgi:hypothetical protein